jgi:hypothetical protein
MVAPHFIPFYSKTSLSIAPGNTTSKNKVEMGCRVKIYFDTTPHLNLVKTSGVSRGQWKDKSLNKKGELGAFYFGRK